MIRDRFEDPDRWDRSLSNAFRIIVGGVLAGAALRFLLDLSIPEVHPLVGIVLIIIASAMLLIIFLLLGFSLYMIGSVSPNDKVELTDEEKDDIAKRVCEGLRDQKE